MLPSFTPPCPAPSLSQYVFLEKPRRRVIQDMMLPPPTREESWAEDDARDNRVLLVLRVCCDHALPHCVAACLL